VDYSITRNDARLSAVLISPVERLENAPTWGKAVGLLGSLVQYVTTDAFTGALFLVLFVGIIDYAVGTKAAKLAGIYSPAAAHRGAMGKITGLLICLILRVVEQYILVQGLVNTRGMLATAVAISLFAVDLQSIAHHRESFGARPIPVLSRVLDWLHALANSRVPAVPADTPKRRATDGD
jgi:hypothetical protein